jgi:hypothetical protein
MSNIWREREGRGWLATAIQAATWAADDLPMGVRFFRFGQGGDGGMALLVRPGVRVWVNGDPVLGGIRILEHRDEVLIDGARLYYSAEARPVVVTFHAEPGVRLPTCPVCRGQVRDGMTAVQCPSCARWFHHELEGAPDRPAKQCWVYRPACLCGHPTALSGEPVWRPELEESRG